MSKLTAVMILVVSTCAAALALPALAQACSCAGPGSADEVGPYYAQMIERADGAVIARVVKVRYSGRQSPSLADDEAIFTIRVRKPFKRFGAFPKGRKLRVHTAANGAACGLELRKGDVAGLFLDRTKGQWNGNLCGQIPPRWMRKGAKELHQDPRLAASGAGGASCGGGSPA